MINTNALTTAPKAVLDIIRQMPVYGPPKGSYNYKQVDALIAKYAERDGNCLQLNEGVLGSGDWILYGPGLKTTIIKEHYTNNTGTYHTVRMYNKAPKKYQHIINAYEAGYIEMIDGVMTWTETGKPISY